LREEGLKSFLTKGVARVTKYVIEVKRFYFYETDLKGHLADWKARVPLVIRPASPEELQQHGEVLEENGLAREEVERRIGRGDVCLLAYSQHEPVFFQWITFSTTWIGEIGVTLLLEPGDSYNYDSVSFPRWRGNQIFPTVLCFANRYERSKGFVREIYYVRMDNASSRRVMKKLGCKRTKTIWWIRLLRMPRPILLGATRQGSPSFAVGQSTDA